MHSKPPAGEAGKVPGGTGRSGGVAALVMLEILFGINSQDKGGKSVAGRILTGAQIDVFVANGAASDQNSPTGLQRLQKSPR
jgi:hypothetical protein